MTSNTLHVIINKTNITGDLMMISLPDLYRVITGQTRIPKVLVKGYYKQWPGKARHNHTIFLYK